MNWRRPRLEMLAVDGDGAWMLEASEHFGVQHGGRKGAHAPLLEDLDEGIGEGVASRIWRNGVPAGGGDGFCDAVACREGGACSPSTAVQEDENI